MEFRNFNFTVVFRPEPEGGYTVFVPSLPGCITYGATLEEARKMTEDAIQGYLESLRKHGEDIRDDADSLVGEIHLTNA